MSALAALALYLITALALTLLTRWLGADDASGVSEPSAPSWRAATLLALLPLLYTAGGFLPGKTLAPTNTLIRVAPWKDPELVRRVEEGSTAPNLLLVDPVSQFLPWSRAARNDLLFNPAQGGGAALVGNGQSAVLFPTEIASRWLTPLRAATYSQAARLLIAAFGLFLLVRALGGSTSAALVGAAVFVGSGYLQLWRLHPHALTAAMVPWIVWAALRLARRPGPHAVVALAVTGALGLAAGHAETLFHGVVLAAVVAVAVLIHQRGGPHPPRPAQRPAASRGLGVLVRPLLAAGAAALLAFLLAAPVLLPFVENLRVSAEWQRRDEIGGFPTEAPWGTAMKQLAFAVTPWAYGDPRQVGADGRPAGPNNAAELAGGAVGGAALLLVLLAFRHRRAKIPPRIPPAIEGGTPPSPLDAVKGWGRFPVDPRGSWRGIWLVLGLIGVLVGAQVPWISRLFEALPWMDLTILGRLSLWAALAAAVLAALGLDGLRARCPRGPIWLLGFGLVAIPLILVAVLLPGSRALPGIPIEALALGLALLAGWRLVHRRSSRVAPTLLAIALVLPRLITFHGWIPLASSFSFYPDSLAVRHIQERLAEDPEQGWRVAGLDAAYLPHAAAFHGLDEARVYDPMTFAPYQRYLALWGEMPEQGGIKLYDPATPGLAFLGVRWIFDHPSMTHRPGVEVTYAGRDALVYDNPNALPRIFLPHEVEIVEKEDVDRAFAEVARIRDPGRRVVLQGEGLLPPGLYPNGTARVVERTIEPGRLTVVVEAEEKTVVATSQPAIPGWRLMRDGEPFEPLRVNGAFLGAAVEPGTSRLEWVYAPRSWFVGWVVFGVGVLVIVGPLSWARLSGR